MLPQKQESTVNEVSYTKKELMASKKYRKYRDVLSVILDDNKRYLLDDVDEKIESFLIKEVK